LVCVLAVLAIVLGGCTPLPDVSPFSTATTQLSSAVRTSGLATADEVAGMTNGGQLSTDLRTAWKARIAAMDAMTSYADSLVAIVNASNDAGNSASALADKVGNLATAAGIINPAAGASVKVAADTAKLVWTNIARARGAASLQDAIDAAQPAIETIAETLALDGKDLRIAVRAAITNEKNELRRDTSVNTVRGLHINAPAAKAGIIGNFDPTGNVGFANQSDLDALNQLLDGTRKEFDASEEKLAALNARQKTLLALIGATDDAIVRWADAHKSLAAAVRARRPIDLSSLMDGIVEVRELVKKVREL
jgi:hypothetical protein